MIMKRILIALVYCAIFTVSSIESTRIFAVSILSGVGARAPSARRFRGEDGQTSIAYDEFGRIHELEEAQVAVDSARSVIVMRLHNSSTVGIMDTTPTEQMLSVPIGIQPINTISPGVQFIATGLSADARFLLRLAKRKAVEHAHLFDKAISTRLLSQYLGRIIRENYMSNKRPLVTHLFIIGDHTIWEISCSGVVQEIVAGAAGFDRRRALNILEEKYNATIIENHQNQAHELIRSIFQPQLQNDETGSQFIRIFNFEDSIIQ